MVVYFYPANTINVMTDPNKVDQQQKPRPLAAILLTVSSAINSMLLFFAFYKNDFAPYVGLLATISIFVTWGLWIGNNAAWALVIIGSVLRIVSLSPINMVFAGATLIIALLPRTRAYFRPETGERSHLSLKWASVLKVLGILFVGLIVIILLAGFFS
jgi:hypothetical protein